MTPEFSRLERIDTVGEGARELAIAADDGERAALARRFGLIAVERLEARLSLWRAGGGIEAQGRVQARVVQACCVTGEPLPAGVDETVRLRFVDEHAQEADTEVELAADDLDVLPIEGGAIDLGEAAAETVALALDPFPRAPGAEQALRAAGVLSEDDTGPFAGLAALKRKLEG